MTVGLSTTAIFGDLGGYFFGNVRDKTSNMPILNGDMLPRVGL